MENKEKYMQQSSIKDRNLLCPVCREEETKEQKRAAELGDHIEHTEKRSTSAIKESYLCSLCIEKANKKLKEDEDKNLPAYKRYLKKKVLINILYIIMVILMKVLLYKGKNTNAMKILCSICPVRIEYAISLILLIWERKENSIHYRSNYLGVYPPIPRIRVCLLLLIPFSIFSVYIYLIYMMWQTATRYTPKSFKYIQANTDIRKMEQDVILKMRKIQVDKRKTHSGIPEKEIKRASWWDSKKSKKNVELQMLCKDVSTLSVRGKWTDRARNALSHAKKALLQRMLAHKACLGPTAKTKSY